jgi:GH24 family phage-related lysozyme (muramidase)
VTAVNRKPVFQAVRALRNGQVFTLAEVKLLDAAIDEAMGGDTRVDTPPTGRQVSKRGIDLMHAFEGCRLDAYPDPGSSDGNPWTIGWGSTGPGIAKGVRWTQAQADERFARDLRKYADEVSKAIGSAPTDQSQFDALVAFHYNTGKIASATLTKKHKAGDYAGAAAEFARWVRNDGKVMKGLVRRRAAEAALYLADG